MPATTPSHKVVIVGGGFGGLLAAQGLNKQPVDVTAHRPPQLPPLPAAPVSGRHRRAVARQHRRPLRSVLRRQRNTRVLLGEVTGFDLTAKTVQLKDGAAIPFDSLIVATGSTHHYFGHDKWAEHCPGPQDDRGRDRDPPPRAVGVRAGRANDRPGRTIPAAHVRRGRRRADRRRDGRRDSRTRDCTRCATTSATSTRRRARSSSSRGRTACSARSTRS